MLVKATLAEVAPTFQAFVRLAMATVAALLVAGIVLVNRKPATG